MPQKTQARLIAEEVAKRFPQTPTLTLAKKLLAENPESYNSVEHARGMLNLIRGKKGKTGNKHIVDKSLFDKKERPKNPFEIPKSYAKKRKHYDVVGKRVLILCDIHVPYHDSEALRIALEEGKKQNCDAIVINGDALDCHHLSDFVKDPKKRKFKEELYALRMFMGYIREEFPSAKIYYKEGNHEARYWKFMRVKAPELIDIDVFDFSSLAHLDKHDIIWVDGVSKLNIGALSIFHGHEFGKQFIPSVNVARGLYLKTKANSMCGHHHQTAEHSERDVNGKVVTCWGVGCLSELSPDYNPYSKYNHGFAIVTKEGSREFSVRNYRIHNGKIL